jgi:hypothetical protein
MRAYGYPPPPPPRRGGLWKLAAVVGGLVLVASNAQALKAHVSPEARAVVAAGLGELRMPDLGSLHLPHLSLPAEAAPAPPTPRSGRVVSRGVTTTSAHGCDPGPDLRSGRLDPRAAEALRRAGQRWRVRVSCVRHGHSRYVNGTRRVSNHTVWRAWDVDQVNGRPVSPRNRDARQLADWLGRLPGPLRPSEIGQPWRSDGPYFTDGGHKGHIHAGWRARRP